jgi:O-antigen ligase
MIAGLVLLASLLSFSRAAYLSLLVAVVFWLFQRETLKFFLKNQIWPVLLILAGIVFFSWPNPLWGRLLSSFNLAEGSNFGRLEMWRAGAQATYEHPWGGVGIGNFANYVDPEADLRSPIYAHNLFLDFGAETGFPNTLILLALVLAPVGAVWFRKDQAPIPERLVATSAVIFLVHSLFETPVYSVRVFPLFLIILAISSLGLSFPRRRESLSVGRPVS